MRNELHIFLSCLHRLTQCSRMFLARDQKCLCLLEDTAGDLSPSAPSPLRGEGWGKKAPGELYKGPRPLDTAGDLSPSAPSPLRGEGWGEAHALWIRQQYPRSRRAGRDAFTSDY